MDAVDIMLAFFPSSLKGGQFLPVVAMGGSICPTLEPLSSSFFWHWG